jgi:hypothetical protein
MDEIQMRVMGPLSSLRTDVSRLLAETKTIVLVDWPSREVPDTLALHGFSVIADEVPETYTAYEAHAGEVHSDSVDGLPQSAELAKACGMGCRLEGESPSRARLRSADGVLRQPRARSH